MSSVKPEFYDFIKKLEENDDKLGSDWNLEHGLDFEYNNSTCHICNGYYGPSFDEPVCVTCHAFLFPDFPSYLPSSYYISEKTDDGDSGNDEPSDLTYMNADRKTNRAALPPWLWNQNSMENEVSPEEVEVFGAPNFAWVGASAQGEGIWPTRPPPPPPPSLARNLQALSIPRPPDNLAPGLVEQLPAEVLLCIFSYLDDLSLAACACVCTRWRRLVRAQVPPTRWAHYVAQRWPLFRPIVLLPAFDWQKMYQTLVDACFCRMCLLQMCTQAQPAGEASHWRRNRLRSELKMIRTDPAEGIAATPLDAKCCHWQATVAGPVGSPYEGGIFYLYIQVPYTYPLSPPVVRFLTRILHPNVSRHGDVGIDSVQHNWSIAFTISKVLISIQSLLTDPYTVVCMEPEVGALYRDSRARFERAARQWTWRYAMLDVIHPLAAASRPPAGAGSIFVQHQSNARLD